MEIRKKDQELRYFIHYIDSLDALSENLAINMSFILFLHKVYHKKIVMNLPKNSKLNLNQKAGQVGKMYQQLSFKVLNKRK
jgi:predicted translin family RNA/ssDNA-binding protein